MKQIIRRSTISLNFANANKINRIKEFMSSFSSCVNRFVDLLWEMEKFSGSFCGKEITDKVSYYGLFTIKQIAANMALHMVKSQRKKKNKTKPIFSGNIVELNRDTFKVKDTVNWSSIFDLFVEIKIDIKEKIIIPCKKHKQFIKFDEDGWELRKAGRLWIRKDGKLFLDVFFKKDVAKYKTEGERIGIDCGYKKLAVVSTGQKIGEGLEQKIEKISRKKQGSKAFKRALIDRSEYINRELKKLDLSNIKSIIVENLKNVKHKTKGKISTKFMNKLQYWVYSYFLNRLEQICEVVGVQYHKINPAYTSQQCSKCGDIHKENRNGEIFKCMRCGYTADADYNASLNILNRFILQEFTAPVQEASLKGAIL